MTEGAPGARKGKARSILVLALTFVLGIGAGLGLAPLLRPPRAHLPPALESLSLRPEQKKKIEAIIDSHGPEVEAIVAESMPRLRVVQERVAVEIEQVLDEGQRTEFRRERAKHPPPLP
jgi:hypothetical protein